MNIDKSKTYNVGEYTFVNFINLDAKTIENIRLWRNHHDIRKVMYNTEEITQEQHRLFINSLSASTSRFYWLVSKYNDPIGVMNIVDVDSEQTFGQLGYYLLPQYLNSGIGLEFISTIMCFSFVQLGLSVLFGRTEIGNKDALRFNYHLGFKLRPKIVEINGMKYVEQDCRAEDFLARFEYITNLKELAKSMKEFNKIYNNQILGKL